uniref:Uncharacterized protein n=1 Tax=Anguilla anguilla TaxID=7936 RepID=A0A0E9WHJ9_ANGAN
MRKQGYVSNCKLLFNREVKAKRSAVLQKVVDLVMGGGFSKCLPSHLVLPVTARVRDPYITCSLFTVSCHIREGESVIVLRCLVAFSDSASWGVFILFFFITVRILESSP